MPEVVKNIMTREVITIDKDRNIVICEIDDK